MTDIYAIATPTGTVGLATRTAPGFRFYASHHQFATLESRRYTRLEEIHTDIKRLADATRPPVVTRQNGRHNGKHSIDQPRKAKS